MLWTYQEEGAADCNAGWGVGDRGGGELGSSSTFAVQDVKKWGVPRETLSLLRIQTLSLDTVFIDYS